MGDMLQLSDGEIPDQLQPSSQVGKQLDREPRGSNLVAAISRGDDSIRHRTQDLLSSSFEEYDDVASTATWNSSASTMSSFYSDRSFLSDQSMVSSSSLLSRSSTQSRELAPVIGADIDLGTQGYPCSDGVGAALALAPRHFGHRRTRSGTFDYALDATLEDRDAGSLPGGASAKSCARDAEEALPKIEQRGAGAWGASRATVSPRRSAKICFATPLVEVAPIEEIHSEDDEEDLAEVAEEPVRFSTSPPPMRFSSEEDEDSEEDPADVTAEVAEEAVPMVPMPVYDAVV